MNFKFPIFKQLRFMGGIFLLWRLNLELWRWAGEKLISARGGYLGPSPWANFDDVHYLHIAKEGYSQYSQ